MARIRIVTDSAADIPQEVAEELSIDCIPVLLTVDDQVYRVGVDIHNAQFYEMLASGKHHFETSAPASAVFEHHYRRLLPEYDTIFTIHSGSKLSSVVSSVQHAVSKLPATMTRVEVVDSKQVSMGLGSIVIAAAQAVKAGAGPDEVGELIASMVQRTHGVFFVDTMEYLEQSGRLTMAASVLGSMQRIKPLMILDEGEIVPYERTRTRAKAIEGLYTFIEDFPNVSEVYALYSTTPEDVEKLLEKVEPIFPRERVRPYQFGPAVAAHLGPGAMGVIVFEGLEQ
jgi:DegV family protein with EDD domain